MAYNVSEIDNGREYTSLRPINVMLALSENDIVLATEQMTATKMPTIGVNR